MNFRIGGPSYRRDVEQLGGVLRVRPGQRVPWCGSWGRTSTRRIEHTRLARSTASSSGTEWPLGHSMPWLARTAQDPLRVPVLITRDEDSHELPLPLSGLFPLIVLRSSDSWLALDNQEEHHLAASRKLIIWLYCGSSGMLFAGGGGEDAGGATTGAGFLHWEGSATAWPDRRYLWSPSPGFRNDKVSCPRFCPDIEQRGLLGRDHQGDRIHVLRVDFVVGGSVELLVYGEDLHRLQQNGGAGAVAAAVSLVAAEGSRAHPPGCPAG